MGQTQSVSRLVDARGPVDHDSVGLTQARPNYSRKSLISTYVGTRGCLEQYYLHIYKADYFPLFGRSVKIWIAKVRDKLGLRGKKEITIFSNTKGCIVDL